MAKSSKKEQLIRRYVGDAVGVAHFVVANLCILVGHLTNVFKGMSEQWGGIEFLYRYLDHPVYLAFRPIAFNFRNDVIYAIIVAELVIVVSSLLYGLAAYLLMRLALALFK